MNKKLLSEKLNNLSKKELAVLQRITFAIETRFYNMHGEKFDDFVGKERFGRVSDCDLFEFARMLNEDFCIVHIQERDGKGFRIFFDSRREYSSFLDFRHMVDKELGRDDGTSADKIYRPFKFKDKELIGGQTTRKIIIKKENSHEYKLLQKAFELPVGERIDAMSFEDTDNLKFSQIYDTARNLNKKIKNTLGAEDFFKLDYSNKYITRNI
jgi:hypothetical protein